MFGIPFLVLPQYSQCPFLDTDDSFSPRELIANSKRKGIRKSGALYFVFESLYRDVKAAIAERKDRT